MAAAIIFQMNGSEPPQTLTGLLDELYPLLGASSTTDLVFWSEQDLVDFLNEGVKRLAVGVGIFAERDTVAVASGDPDYNLPARHLSTIAVSLDGAELRPMTVAELEALDADWPNTTGDVERYLQDVEGTETIRLYPEPEASGTLAVVCHRYPADVAAAGDVPLPRCLADGLGAFLLAEARRAETDGAMPEVAQFCDGMAGLYTQLFQAYWGGAQ